MYKLLTFTLLASFLFSNIFCSVVNPIGHHGNPSVIGVSSHPKSLSLTTQIPAHPSNNDTKKSPLHLTFTTQMPKIHHPFNVTCAVKGDFVDHDKVNYSIVFYKTADTAKHLIARFDVLAPTASHPAQRIIFADTVHKSNKLGELTLTPSESVAYPNFTILVEPHLIFHRENYWCELEVPLNNIGLPNNHKTLSKSNLWINTPILTLTTERVKNTNDQRVARCQIEHFDLIDYKTGGVINSTTVSYEVNFFIDDNQVALFNVTQHRMEVFKPFSVPLGLKRTILGHGPNAEYPLFEMLYKVEDGMAHGFQCNLVYNGLFPTSSGGNVNSQVVFSL